VSSINVAEPWSLTNPGLKNPLANTKSEYLKFLNTRVFSESALHFLKHGYYCNAPVGTKDYHDYWNIEEDRCLNGYTVGGVRITGRHYFMLNFGLMKARAMDPVTGKESKSDRKVITFPRFLDHQYYLFHEMEECFAEGKYEGDPLQGLIIAKSRRKGITYVNAAGVLVYNYNFIPASNNILCAYETSHYKVTVDATWLTVNHLNQNTDFAKRRLINRHDYIKAGYKYTNDFGQEIEDGYLSEIRAMSFKDNQFKSIGESCTVACWEECLGFGTKVLMYDGTLKDVQDIILGDLVMGIDSKPKKVIRLCSGIDDNMYEVSQQKGISYTINSKHKLYLEQKTNTKYYIQDDGYKIYNINEINSLVKAKRKTLYGVKSSGLEFDKKELNIDPYYIGIWLGDGDSADASVVVCDKDVEIEKFIKDYSSKIGLSHHEYFIKNKSNNCKTITILEKPNIKNKFKQLLSDYNLIKNKHIPYDYTFTTSEDRLQLLAGLIDTDGYLCKGTSSYSFSYEIIQKNKRLSYDIVYLCQTLGLYVRIKQKKSSWVDKKTNEKKYGVVYRINIRGDINKIPVRVERKKPPTDWIATSNPLNTQIEIKNIGRGSYYGFTLEGDNDIDHLFMLEDFTITHNCGKFENLIGSYTFTEPTWRDGSIMTGSPVVWGTGGDMEGGSQDFAEMFYNPKTYGFKAYDNIYDDNATGECGYFIDAMWYYPGKYKDKSTGKSYDMIDEQGNSLRDLAEQFIDNSRIVKKKGTAGSYQKYLTQEPKTPAEAFLRIEGSLFDAVNAQIRLGEIQANTGTYIDSIHVVNLIQREDGKVVHEYRDDIFPIREYPLKNTDDTTGAIEIYEMPVYIDGIVPGGIYIAGVDPYSDDKALFSNSLGSCFIMNRMTDRIVAEYTARPKTTYQYFENVRKLLLFYNASCNYESTRKGMFAYFERMSSLHLLCDMPQFLKDQQITRVEAVGNNAKGTPGSENVNSFARDSIINYCATQAYDKEPGVTNVYTIRSIGLLKELISWNTKGNFDRVSSLGMLMVLRESLCKHRASYEEEDELEKDDFFTRNDGTFFQSIYNKDSFLD